ncbi:MAG: hypothetical protein IJH84_24725 [Saccharopolyspora sp.]|nr:hypothetical protein [Saccharopolyspora sp.]MBQ6644213.1 hypothetical protein [Saccharopolyspora sp.]
MDQWSDLDSRIMAEDVVGDITARTVWERLDEEPSAMFFVGICLAERR